jgi:hypothetical protein
MNDTHGIRIVAVSAALAASLGAMPPRAADAPSNDAPASKRVELGVEERVRSENWDNIRDFSESRDDTTHQWRFRTRLWSRFSFGSRAEVSLVVNNETRKVTEPDTKFRWDEVIVESLSLDWKLSPRFSAKLGRQDLMRGEGFVLMDGGPLDGSRTAYFNALDVTGRFGKTAVELIGISDPRQDEYLPVLNDRDRLLVEWDEKAVGAYVTDKTFKGTTIEGYLFRKTESGDKRPTSNAQYQPDRTLGTLGGRLARDLGKGFSVAAEAAYERGSQDPDVPIRAWGGYAIFRYTIDDPARPTFALGWIGMSGDDPKTSTIEGWDPLFSRWPKWSELYIYSQLSEKGIAYWTNLGMWMAEMRIAPVKPLAMRFTWYGLSAMHPFHGDPAVYGSGKDRGDLIEVRGDVTLPAGFKGHVLYERLAPGSYYVGTDTAWFFRVEATYTFKRSLRLG